MARLGPPFGRQPWYAMVVGRRRGGMQMSGGPFGSDLAADPPQAPVREDARPLWTHRRTDFPALPRPTCRSGRAGHDVCYHAGAGR